ncbi:MAG: hypothetical protein WBQ86_21955 [Candidatus Binatus sp.]
MNRRTIDPWEMKEIMGVGKRTLRSESVTVRLEPRIRYFAELAARTQRRTLSSFIEEAITSAIRLVFLRNDKTNPQIHSLLDEPELWDVFEPDRFAKLALRHPELLTHHEQIVWKLIQENELVWRKNHWSDDGELVWSVEESNVIWKKLREHWKTFNKVARGELPPSALPATDEAHPITEEKF